MSTFFHTVMEMMLIDLLDFTFSEILLQQKMIRTYCTFLSISLLNYCIWYEPAGTVVRRRRRKVWRRSAPSLQRNKTSIGIPPRPFAFIGASYQCKQ